MIYVYAYVSRRYGPNKIVFAQKTFFFARYFFTSRIYHALKTQVGTQVRKQV